MKKQKYIEIMDKKINSLTVIKQYRVFSKFGDRYYCKCLCDCGSPPNTEFKIDNKKLIHESYE